MTPRKAKRMERKPKVNWRERCEQWQKEFTKIIIERAGLLSDCSDLRCELSGLREIEGKLNARVGELEEQRKAHCDFTHDLQMLMASQWDVMCGTRLINVRAISMLLEKYQ